MPPYWAEQDYKKLAGAERFSDLLPIALDIVRRIPPPACAVCGPIATGGLGSIEANLAVFEKAIAKLHESGKYVFSQMPFEAPMQKMKLANGVKGYAMDLLQDFYQPLFESGMIKEFYFLPNWQTSFGARWEHEQAERLGIKRAYLPADWDTVPISDFASI